MDSQPDSATQSRHPDLPITYGSLLDFPRDPGACMRKLHAEHGDIAALQDGDLKLFESMAINLYLTKKYAPSLYPSNEADEAKTNQWSVWAISEIEPLQMQIVVQTFFVPEDKRDAGVIERAGEGLQRPLKVLDQALDGRDWLVGDEFSVADLNVAAVMLLLTSNAPS